MGGGAQEGAQPLGPGSARGEEQFQSFFLSNYGFSQAVTLGITGMAARRSVAALQECPVTLSPGSVRGSVPPATTGSTVTKVRQGRAGQLCVRWKLSNPHTSASQNDTKALPEPPGSPSPLQMIGWVASRGFGGHRSCHPQVSVRRCRLLKVGE